MPCVITSSSYCACPSAVTDHPSTRLTHAIDRTEHLRPDQALERFRKLSARAVFVDVELLEEGLVEEPPVVVTRSEISRMTVADEIKGCSQVRLYVVGLHPRGGQASLDDMQLARNAILLTLEEVERQSACLVGLQEFRALVHKPLLLNDQRAQLGVNMSTTCG